MAKSTVQRIEGVPLFSSTKECLDFVADCNTRAAGLKLSAKENTLMARNAAKQLIALASGIQNDDRREEFIEAVQSKD